MKCPRCGTEVTAGGRCESCGQAVHDTMPELLQTGQVCPRCETFNPINALACSNCGEHLGGLGELEPVLSPVSLEDTVVEQRQAVPGTGAAGPNVSSEGRQRPPRRTASLPAFDAAGKPEPPIDKCRRCGAPLKPPGLVCSVCGHKQAGAEHGLGTASIRLRLIRGYGSEDTTWPIGPSGLTVGRSAAMVKVTQDPYLSPVHFRLSRDDGKLLLEDTGSVNGTFLRARGAARLSQGTEFIAGQQRLLVVGLGGPTRDSRIPASPDTKLLGSPQIQRLFVALRTLHRGQNHTPAAAPIMLRAGPVVTLGRAGCDLDFPADSRMAPRHAEIHVKPTGLEVIPTGSTGVFIRVKERTALQNGDEILAGEELFRVEMD